MLTLRIEGSVGSGSTGRICIGICIVHGLQLLGVTHGSHGVSGSESKVILANFSAILAKKDEDQEQHPSQGNGAENGSGYGGELLRMSDGPKRWIVVDEGGESCCQRNRGSGWDQKRREDDQRNGPRRC